MRSSPAASGWRRGGARGYLEVMGTPGIFAERLELEGLAEVLGAPLHLYYHLSGSDAAAAGAAAEVIHPPLGEVAAAPVCLLHRVAARRSICCCRPSEGEARPSVCWAAWYLMAERYCAAAMAHSY